MPVPKSVDIRTSAEPSSSVRSVALASAAIAASALPTAFTAVLALSVPQPVAATSAAAVTATQAAVCRFVMSPPQKPCVRREGRTLSATCDMTAPGMSVRIADG
ncbi:hypothetical protein ACE1SV_23090 [Streptomyces sp. E-15]